VIQETLEGKFNIQLVSPTKLPEYITDKMWREQCVVDGIIWANGEDEI
jgi:hypothetical protein